ncbi:MAG: alpha-galactosidase [Verrucomicrobia bacterium]|nr:alpha-galactosidase [Verrucomicrobiota bacterium]MCG2679174.1 alpha-galactosidase [Kiritimatiellia bacterium]MBU4247908.1 alpha-galactosidase [Verrucomicrobiota bacterium]MBU4291286.1 alpha-galactosidase [Verrucomicrobiota bacterium]MBU4429464.1 alpha-galactosidase [Verrucomicrobiota bacterium]
MKKTWSDCYAIMDGAILKIGNHGIERNWDLSQGAPAAISIRDRRRKREWAAAAPYRDAFRHPHLPLVGPPKISLEAGSDTYLGISAKHFRVVVSLAYPNVKLRWQHRIWPELPIIWSQFDVKKTGVPAAMEPEKFVDRGILHFYPSPDRLDFFGLEPPHLTYHVTTFTCQSDHHDNLVQERSGFPYPKEDIREPGAYWHLCDRVSPGGLLALKLAPSPREQINYPGHDFACSGRTLAITGTGFSAGELETGAWLSSYAYAVGVTDGAVQSGADLFYRLDRQRMPPNPAVKFTILSNTWGDGNGCKNLNEAMFSEEIKTAARLGLTHCQVDAGWQKGRGMDKSPHGIGSDFWTVHPEKFPRGLKPIADLAKQHGIRLGFWFDPDHTRDNVNWRKDVEVILEMWRECGFDAVKIDDVSVLTKKGEANFLALLRELHLRTGGKLCVNFDITGGSARRTGFFYNTEFTGNLFVENRYTNNQSYYPHRTLRNLWQLCKYIPSHRLQMEFVNTEINKDRYAGDPLGPAQFGTEYSCAITLFSNPLCWMEVAQLSEADQQRLAKLIHVYRPHQEAILRGRVYPIGEEPSGQSWTGFQSVTGPRNGYLMIFRELTPRPAGIFILQGVKPGATLKLKILAGAGRCQRVKADRQGAVRVALPRPKAYVFMKYTLVSNNQLPLDQPARLPFK